ncbi:MAG TPA: helicase-related protein [Candidatus Eisenbacteria bacterium]|nr:helicase-related protein [Candidatus Eisenbacteria bacterium]
MASESGIRDNCLRGNVGDFLRAKIREGSELSFVSAFFTIYAFRELRDELSRIGHLNFLFGEPRFLQSLDPERTAKKYFRIEQDTLALQNKLHQKRAARECAEWITNKVDIRSVKQTGFLHGKMYHIANNGVEEAILGSSNFTVRGLGLAMAGNNIELNLEVNDSRDRRDLKSWFEEIWNDPDLVADVKADVLAYLQKLYQNHSPQFIYFKTLFHIFEKQLTDLEARDTQIGQSTLVDTDIWKMLFEFQKDGVKGAINKILTHNGCVVADSVGLGKTFEALAVIKYFELKNERALVLCPKKLRENWTVYRNNDELNPFVGDRFRYDVLSHTDLSRERGLSGDLNLETLNWGNYDLVVIDESHNFRNNTKGRRSDEGDLIRKSRYERLMDDIIRSGVKTKVLLLSATPVNNTLRDLRNQLYILTEGSDDAFKDSIGIASLQETIRQAQQQFSIWAKLSEGERKTSILLERLGGDLFKLLDELTIARSRKHIQSYYKDSLQELGGFPKRLKPVSVFPEIDLKNRFMSYDRLNEEIARYKLSLFNPSKYVLPQYQPAYEAQGGRNFTQADREHFLIAMMKVNFLKRLESCVNSFEISMNRTIRKIEVLEQRIARHKQYRAENPDLDFDELTASEEDDPDLQQALEVGGKLKFRLAHLDLEQWLQDLQQDKQQLNALYVQSKDVDVDRDAKLAELKKLIEGKVRKPTQDKSGRPNRKVLLFTAFADTAVYLYDALRDWVHNTLGIHCAIVTGGSAENQTTLGKKDFNHILTNFSPVSKRRSKIPSMPQETEIDLLIATDCISEGQNLQDCDYLINYDIHWNPVRIIQRFGRIDRIGTINKAVQLVNFWPTPNLDKYISLKQRVEARMALVDITATFEGNILQTEEIEELIKDDLRYRDRQLLRLKDEVLDLEDFTEGVALNEFTLDDFRVELLKFLESNRALLEEAPLGLYTVVPSDVQNATIAPGVLFCVRQESAAASTETLNPLQPYFLVYVLNDGNIRFGFTQPKQILEIFRLLCSTKPIPHERLCDLFDQETRNGSDMTAYSKLLSSAVTSIEKTFRRRAVGQLLQDRGGKLLPRTEQVNEGTEFDLITWVVIKNGQLPPSSNRPAARGAENGNA